MLNVGLIQSRDVDPSTCAGLSSIIEEMSFISSIG